MPCASIQSYAQWPLIKVTNCEFVGLIILVVDQLEGAQITDIMVGLEEKWHSNEY